MASGGSFPFLPLEPSNDLPEEQIRFSNEMRQLHSKAPVPNLDFSLNSIVHHCLEKEPQNRVQSFKELRASLEALLKQETGETIAPPSLTVLDDLEWNNKGSTLASLGRHEEAIHCYDEALKLDLRIAAFWYNKGNSLCELGRFEEAICCYDRALDFIRVIRGLVSVKAYLLDP